MTTSTTQQKRSPELPQEPTHSAPRQVIGRFVEPTSPSPIESNGPALHDEEARQKRPIALFCYERHDSFIGQQVDCLVRALAARGREVHLICREGFSFNEGGVASKLRPLHSDNIRVHTVGSSVEIDAIEQVHQFARRASNTFLQALPNNDSIEILGFEWTSAPVLSLLKGLRNLSSTLSLHSVERQRSDLSSELSRRITEIEYEGIQTASSLLVHEPATTEVMRQWVPTCVDRVVQARHVFPTYLFERELDPGEIKARYQIGPVDPTLLYIGDLDERYGPDVILKAMPAILRHHPQARLVLVGDGQMLWPLKVYARYLLLEHAVRLVGDVRDVALQELIQASDMIVVPSRESTPWWPIQAAWAARKPVVATHDAARGFTEHEKDSVLVYPSENSLVWGVERVLYDETLRKNLAIEGRQKLEDRFGWNGLAEQLEEVLSQTSRARG